MQNGPVYLTNSDLSVLTTTKQTSYGTVGLTGDGREFRYASFGGTTTLAPGLLLQAATAAQGNATNSQGMVITATSVTGAGQTTANLTAGSTQLVVTGGGTSYTQDQFAEGFMDVIWSGGPITYKIKGNSASTATNGYTTIYLYPEEPLRNTAALVPGTDTVNLWISPYSTLQSTTTVNVPIGATVNNVVNTASVTNYGWVQTKGEAVLTADASSVVIGNTIGPSTNTAGYVGLSVAQTKPAVGWSKATQSTGGAGLSAFLNIN